MDPQVEAMLSHIDQMMTDASGALTATNAQAFNQQVAEFNANYGNQQASQYGYNTGTTANGIVYPQQYAPTLSAQQDIGSIGYVPGYSGVGAAQSLAGLSQNQQLTQQNASNTGFYNTPMNSPYTPGTFLNIDPSTYPSQYGTQMDYVLPSGQLQRVTPQQAQAMGFKGQVSGTVSILQALGGEAAPPSSIPQETLGAQGQYMNLNTQAQNQAVQQANATGMYTQPGQIVAPGTNMLGATFGQLDPQMQQTYFQAHGGDWNAAMQAWVNDSNKAILQANPNAQSVTQPGAPQETMQAQQQFFNQALQGAGLTGLVMNPGTPGNPGQSAAGSSGLQPGQVVRNQAGQFGLVSQYGTITPTDASNPMVYQAIQANQGIPTLTNQQWTQGQGMETQQAQQQMFNQANQLGTEYGQYYAPMMPGQTATAGVNTPQIGQITEQGREFNTGTAVDLSKLASSLSGPADYFKYLQALNGGNNILSNLYNGQAQAPGGQVGSTGGTQSLDNILGQFGLSSGQLTGGKLPTGTYGGFQPQAGQSQASSLNLPAPNQIQPAAYNSMSPSAQQFVQGAYQSAGYNPQDLNWFMNAATPAATQSTPGVAGGGTQGTSTHFANPSTQSLFA